MAIEETLILTEEWGNESGWNFEAEADFGHEISTEEFVSSPSSLKLYAIGRIGTTERAILSTNGGAQALSEGRIVSQLWNSTYSGSWPAMIFRNQAALGSANLYNCYFVKFGGIQLVKYVSGVEDIIGSFDYIMSSGLWYKYRLTWWEADDNLNCKLEQWDTSGLPGEWRDEGTLIDSDNQ